MKKFIFTHFLFFLSVYTGGVAFCQQTSTLTLFSSQLLPSNPAVAGWLEVPSFTLSARQQWIGLGGSPSTQILSFQTPFLSKRLGIGGSIENEFFGIESRQTVTVPFAYSLIRTPHLNFRMGLQAVARRMQFDFGRLQNLADLDDPALPASGAASPILFNVGAGAMLKYRDSWLGFSIPSLIENEFGFAEKAPFTSQESRFLQVTGGVIFPVTETLDMRGSFNWKKPNTSSPWLIEMGGQFVWRERVGVGASYRASRNSLEKVGESMSLLASYGISDQMTVFVAYDFPFNGLAAFHNGSAEFSLRYDLRKAEVNMSNPRFR